MNPEEILRLNEREMCPPRLGLYVGLGDGVTRIYQSRYGAVSGEG